MTLFSAIVFSNRAWLIPAVLVLLLLAIALIWAGHRSAAERRVRLGCGLLKLIGIVALVLCLLDPLWVTERARPGANVFAVMADNSQGLQVKDAGDSQSRSELLREQLTGDRKEWRSALDENFQVRRYTFDSRLQSTRDFSELNFNGRASALGSALRTATEHWRGQPVAGVLLFTDGNATDITGDLPALEGCPPIYPVVVGRDSEIRDLSLKKVGVSQTAFEDAPVTVQAEVSASGFPGAEIEAHLTEVAASVVGTNATDGPAPFRLTGTSNVVAQMTRTASGNGSLDFRFRIQPQQAGIHFYQLETRVKGELNAASAETREATLVNNRRIIVVDRGQEPFRVLYVSGRPNWEFKFLNRAVQEDPQVQVVSLIRVARREPKFEFKGREGETSNPLFRGFGRNDEEMARYDQPVLIRLNTKDEFELRGGFPKVAEELFRYQAVVIDDVEAEFFTHDQLALLHRFVSERGGGLLMLGGADSFREGNYASTPVASMLPVYLDRAAEMKWPDEAKLMLTREGWLQPWTRLRSTEAEERSRLEAQPGFAVINPAREIKPGASVLATVSDSEGLSYPALAAQRFGHGRTAAMMIGDLWRSGLQDETTQKDLAKAWRQLVRWLVSDVPQRVSVASTPSPGGDAGEVRLTVKVRDEEYKPLDNAAVQLIVRPVAAGGPGAETNYVQLTAEPTAEPGTYTAAYIARETGAYSVEARVTQADGKPAGQAAAGWTSDPAAEEFRSLKPNRALLQALAQRTGGEVVSMENLESFVRRLPERRSPVMESWSNPLWHKPAVLLFVLGCFVTEWGVRRWKGLP